MLPNKTKYSKAQKGGKVIDGVAKSSHYLAFGLYGLKALSAGELKSNQIESARRSASKNLKKTGKLFIRVFPHIPVSGKPGVRLGKGKGSVSYWMCRIKPGMILFEVDGVSKDVAFDALSKASAKLPFKTKIVEYI